MNLPKPSSWEDAFESNRMLSPTFPFIRPIEVSKQHALAKQDKERELNRGFLSVLTITINPRISTDVPQMCRQPAQSTKPREIVRIGKKR